MGKLEAIPLIYDCYQDNLSRAFNILMHRNNVEPVCAKRLKDQLHPPMETNANAILGREFADNEIVIEIVQINRRAKHAAPYLKQMVAAIDGALQETIGAKSLTPPKIVISEADVPKKNAFGTISRIDKVYAVFVIDKPFYELPYENDNMEAMMELAKRNYDLLSKRSAKVRAFFNADNFPDLAFTTPPRDIYIADESIKAKVPVSLGR